MTALELALLTALAAPGRNPTDAALRARLGVDQTTLLSLGQSLRTKLGITPMRSLRDAIRKPRQPGGPS